MDDIPLSERFPGLQVGRKPSIGTFTTLSGRCDYDPATGTYVITNYVCLLSMPLIAIGAYRVADADGGGLYCLGRVPLNSSAKKCNIALLLAVLAVTGGIWWYVLTHSNEYLAREKLKQADVAAAAGKGGEAAKLCRAAMDMPAPKAAEDAKQKFAGYLENPPGAPSEAAAVYSVAADLHRENRCPVPDLFATGTAVATRYAADDPHAALALLEIISPFATDPEAELAFRRELLEKLFAKSPNDPDVASRLAATYEAKGDRVKCEQLLAPFEKQLGSLDGAAILGRIYAARGENDRAYALLRPYVDTRLPAFRSAEQHLVATVKAVEDRVMNGLKSENAPGFDFQKAKRLNKEQQGEMVSAYFGEQMKNDPDLREARKRLISERGIVSAGLDLGMLQLQRGQAAADPAARKSELEAAEKTFLSIRGVAGESDQYRLTLGQVYHWLGRPADAKKLFDEFIASHGKASESLLAVANVMREVGDVTAARKMAEDAYNQETDQQKKQSAARIRALMRIDSDDEITWLTRSNRGELGTQADLESAYGRKASQSGNDEEAAAHFRKAIEIYEKMPESASTLNNGSLSNFELYRITQNKADHTRGMDKLDRAIALQPSDSILLSNGVSTVIDGALIDILGNAIDFKALKQSSSWDALSYLYRGKAERIAVLDKFVRHPGTVKGRAYSEKLLTLAPKRPGSYSALTAILEQARDLEGLKAMLARLEKADLDHGDDARESKEYLAGTSDARRSEDAKKSLARAETAMAAARGRKDRTFAYAAGRYIHAKEGVWAFGENVDADALVKLAEEAHATAPSDGTESLLVSTLLFRAHTTLIRVDAEYAKLAAKTKRSLGFWLVYCVLAEDGPLKAKVAANPDVKQLAVHVVDEARSDTDEVGPASLALLRAVNPDEAKSIAEKVKANERRRVQATIHRMLSPYSAALTFSEVWLLQLDGKDVEAKKLLAELSARGVPIP